MVHNLRGQNIETALKAYSLYKPHLLFLQEVGGLSGHTAPIYLEGPYMFFVSPPSWRRCVVGVPRGWADLTAVVDAPIATSVAVELNTAGGVFTCCSAHLPHSGYDPEARRAAWGELETWMVRHRKPIVGGDWNSGLTYNMADGEHIGYDLPADECTLSEEFPALIHRTNSMVCNSFTRTRGPHHTHEQGAAKTTIDWLLIPRNAATAADFEHVPIEDCDVDTDHLQIRGTLEFLMPPRGPFLKGNRTGWTMDTTQEHLLIPHFDKYFQEANTVEGWTDIHDKIVMPELKPPAADTYDPWMPRIKQLQAQKIGESPEQRRITQGQIWAAQRERRRRLPAIRLQRAAMRGRVPEKRRRQRLPPTFEGSAAPHEWPEAIASWLGRWTKPTAPAYLMAQQEVDEVGDSGEGEVAPGELEGVIRGMGRGRGAGLDGITVESLVAILRCAAIGILAVLFTRILLGTHPYPEAWRSVLLFMLPKVPVPSLAHELRPIAMISVLAKSYHRVLERRLSRVLTFPPWVLAYQRGKQARELPLCLYLLLEQSRQWGLEAHICKLDLQKAYDSVAIDLLPGALGRLGVKAGLVRPIMEAIRLWRYQVSWAGHCSQQYRFTSGLLQGDPLSPTLFNVALADALCGVVGRWNADGVGIWIEGHGRINILDYSDDLYVCSTSPAHMARQLTDIANALCERGMHLQAAKSKYLAIGSLNPHVRYRCGNEWAQIDRSQELMCMGIPLRAVGTGRHTLQTLRAKCLHAAHAQVRLLRGTILPTAVRIRLIMPRMDAIFQWFAGLAPWTQTQLRALRGLQHRLAVISGGARRRPEEDWLTAWRRRHRAAAATLREAGFQDWALRALHARLRFGGHIARLPPERAARMALFFRNLEHWREQQHEISSGHARRHPGRYNSWRWEAEFERLCGTPAWHSQAMDREGWRLLIASARL